MNPQNSSPPPGSSYPSLVPVLIGTSLKVEIERAARLSLAMTLYLLNAAARIDLPPVDETSPASMGPMVLRANLHASTRHAAMGHEASTFRDCSRLMCRNAANLVPYPMATKPSATDAELDATSQRAMLTVQPLLATLRSFRRTPPLPRRRAS